MAKLYCEVLVIQTLGTACGFGFSVSCSLLQLMKKSDKEVTVELAKLSTSGGPHKCCPRFERPLKLPKAAMPANFEAPKA